jgi:Asp-tRNA(Asn)/Glu-tRNA(Gln) amidotransferase A subunit family amidase
VDPGGSAAAVAAGIVPAAHATDGGGFDPHPCVGLRPVRDEADSARVPARPRRRRGVERALLCARGESQRARQRGAARRCRWTGRRRPLLGAAGGNVLSGGQVAGQLRIALTAKAFNGAPVDAQCKSAVEDAAKLCESLGHQVSEAAPILDYATLGLATRTIVGANILANLRDEPRRSVATHRTTSSRSPSRSPRTARRSTRQEYAASIRTVHKVGRQLAAFFADYARPASPHHGGPAQAAQACCRSRTRIPRSTWPTCCRPSGSPSS